jgi:CRP/FNR family transcriptional regulator
MRTTYHLFLGKRMELRSIFKSLSDYSYLCEIPTSILHKFWLASLTISSANCRRNMSRPKLDAPFAADPIANLKQFFFHNRPRRGSFMNQILRTPTKVPAVPPQDNNWKLSPLCRACSARQVCKSGVLADFDIAHLVVNRCRVVRHASLYRESDRLEMLYTVCSGQFKLIHVDATGNNRVAQFYMAGEMVGLDGIATGRHNFRLVALENSEVCAIPLSAIMKTMESNRSLQKYLLRSMSSAINHQYGLAAILAKPSLDSRFAGFLLQLSEKYSHLGYCDKIFRLSMARGDIASYLGTTVESVSRLVARFNAHGAVSITSRSVEMVNHELLTELLTGGGLSKSLQNSRKRVRNAHPLEESAKRP